MYSYIMLYIIYTLWLFNIAMEAMVLIEIDGLPNLKMVDFSMAMLNNQMVYTCVHIYVYTCVWLCMYVYIYIYMYNH